jgi:hypothetical protein
VPAELFEEGLVELHEGDLGGTGEGREEGSDEREHAASGEGEREGDWAVLTPRGRLLANEVTVRLRL